MSDASIADVALHDNTSERLACVLVLDGSSSMGGSPIDELNAGLRLLEDELKKDDEASQKVQLLVIRFGGDSRVEVLSNWQDAMEFQAPTIIANGLSPLGEAARLALVKIEEQKARYRANGIKYKRPWLFLHTDGEATDEGWELAAAACFAAEQEKKVVIFGIGAGAANLEKLARFSSRKPMRLQGLKYRELFLWLSSSVSSASKTTQDSNVQMPPPTDWAQVPI